MATFFKKLFGPKADLAELYKNGASIVDVRSKSEFASGHIKGSINIPLDAVAGQVEQIRKLPQPIITCCASGMRSGVAKGTLKSKGIEAYNGGGWVGLQSTIKKK